MARTRISEFSATAADNTDIDSIDIAEGCAPSGINNAIRELMAQLKDFQTGAAGDPFNGAVNGTVGATTPAAGAFTTLSASSTVSGTGFSNYLASPPAIGGTAAAAGTFTNLAYTGTLTGGTGVINIGSGQVYKDASGNVGIGTSSPTTKLDVVGIAKASGGLQIGINTDINFNSGSDSNSRIRADGTSGTIDYFGFFGHRFYTTSGGNTERMRLDSSGNLGLGVTPSAWNTNRKALQIGGNTVASVSLGAAIGENLYNAHTAASNFIYATNGPAASVDFNNATSGGFAWRIAPSGTAGNAISFTQAMTLDASGNLGIGTTSPGSTLELARASADVGLYITRSSTGAASYRQFIDGDGDIRLNMVSSKNMRFFTADTERARIDSSGNLLVGASSGDAKLYVQSSSINNNVGSFSVSNTNATADACVASFITATNSTATSNVLLKFIINGGASGSGQINANGASQAAFGGFSDRRLKENIVDLPPQLEKIMALRPVEFDYIASMGGGHQISFVAQEFEEVYPDAVGEDSNGMKTLTGWGKTEARLVKAIQELKAEFDAYKAAHP